MQNPNDQDTASTKTLLLTLLAFIGVSFVVQAGSHFILNVEHYAAITIMRSKPIMQLGIATMVIQGLLLGWLFPRVRGSGRPFRDGVVFAWTMGLFLGSYIVLAEAAKYDVLDIAAWMFVEGTASFVQFTVFGILLGLIHRRTGESP